MEDTAVVGERIKAQIIDWGVIFLSWVVVLLLLGGLDAILPASFRILVDIIGVSALFGLLAYALFMEGYWNGKTVGKHLTGVKVVKENGSPCTYTASLIRNIPVFLWFSVLIYLVGFASMATTDKRQRLFDRIAGTVVVRDS